MKFVKLLTNLYLLLISSLYVHAGQWCPSYIFRAKSKSTKSISAIQSHKTIVGQSAVLGNTHHFTVLNFVNEINESLEAIAKKKGSFGDLEFTIWVEKSAYEQNALNNLNSENFIGGALIQLQQDRDTVIDEIYRILSDQIISGMIDIFGDFPEIPDAAFKGLNILLYDIKDTFAIDGGYVGGYFNPDDIEISKINLLHMDINPLNPGGRKVIPQISRNDFFQTLTHELFHLKHYYAAGSFAWNNLSQWIQEGFAQFAIYRILKDAQFSTSSRILEWPDKGPSQVPFYLLNPNVTHLGQNFINSPLPVEYYGLGYLFFTHLWKQSGIDQTQRDKIFNQLLKSEIKNLDSFKNLLQSNGINFESIYEQFVLYQYFSTNPFEFDFIKLLPDSVLGEFKSESPVNLSNLAQSTLAKVQPYEVRYLPINNDSSELKRLQFKATCPATFGDQCVSCNDAHRFRTLVLPDRSKVRECANSKDPFSCVLSLGHQSIAAEGTTLNLNLPPGQSNIAFYSTQSIKSQPRACFNFVGSSDIEQPNLPVFSNGPLFELTNNKLELKFAYEDIDSSDVKFSFFVDPQQGDPFFPKYSISTQTTTLSVDKTYQLTWYFLEDIPRLHGSEIYLYLKDLDQDKVANPFRLRIFAQDQLQTITSQIKVFPGWNMLALQPQYPNQTLSEAITNLATQIAIEDCSLIYQKGQFYAYSLSQNSCAISTQNSIFEEPIQWGQGVFANSTTELSQILNWSHVLLPRWKYKLKRGWNLQSLGLKKYPELKQVSPTVPLAYYYDASVKEWQKLILFGRHQILHISDQNNFSTLQAHWIYSLNERDFVYDSTYE